MNLFRKIISNINYSTIKTFFSHRNYRITKLIGCNTINVLRIRPYVLLCLPMGLEEIGSKKDVTAEDIVGEIMKGYSLTEDKMISFIKTIESKFVEVCEKYREHVQKQIKILQKHKDELNNTASTVWDDVVKSRSEAETFKQEIIKLQSVIDNIQQMSYDMLGTSSLLGSLQKAASGIEQELEKLRKIVDDEINKNKSLEKQLLEETRLDILKSKKK